MSFYSVIIEHESLALARTFTYASDFEIEPGCRVTVPFGKQKLTGMVICKVPEPEHPEFKIRKIIDVIDPVPVLSSEQIQLAEYLSWQTVSSVMSMVNCMLPSALSSKTKRSVLSSTVWLVRQDEPAETEEQKSSESLTPSQQQAAEKIGSAMELSLARTIVSDYMIQTLISKGKYRKEKRSVYAAALPKRKQIEWPQLNPAQQNALQAIESSDNPVSVLYGVTGSGKTEIYYHLARKALDEGKQVLILVPEIVLTPMMEERFLSRFKEDVYSYHSRLTDAQALSVWNSISEAGPCVVIGTRKSIFLPFTNLGLIVMDEEHDSSYKQESTPRYHARDAVLHRAKSFGCPVVLGSATPSLDTYSRALKGVYNLVELEQRALNINNRIRLVDLRMKPQFANFSSTLISAIQSRLDKQEKAMILLNRRGYLPTVRCLSCGEYLKCEDCDLPLSYHKKEDALVCHVCGRRYPVIPICPNCGSNRLATTGQGTERLEEDTHSLFPKAKLVRMDADTTSRKGEHARRLAEFDQSGDILLGTQMIAKGLDFHEITLCAILSIDTLLARPDYLASEKAYQLAEQASGRAGRGKKPGEVLIQTFDPDHFVLQSVLHHDYKAFYRQEMMFRKGGGNPPYTYMASVVIRHEDPVTAYNKACEIRRRFEECGIHVLGPAQISMRNKQSRMRLILRCRNDAKLIETLWQCAAWFYTKKNSASCRIDVNVHPMSIEE